MTDVKCKVQTCYYWGNNDVCKADTIMVDNNTGAAGRTTPMETGTLDVNSPSGRGSRSARSESDRGSTDLGGRNRAGRVEAADLTVGSVIRGGTRDFEAGNLTAGNVTDTNKTQSQVHASTSHETLCSTFRPKGTEPKH